MIICLETLNIKGMLKNKRLSRVIQEKAWHMFIRILEQKAKRTRTHNNPYRHVVSVKSNMQ